jgi:hypothetical protein
MVYKTLATVAAPLGHPCLMLKAVMTLLKRIMAGMLLRTLAKGQKRARRKGERELAQMYCFTNNYSCDAESIPHCLPGPCKELGPSPDVHGVTSASLLALNEIHVGGLLSCSP